MPRRTRRLAAVPDGPRRAVAYVRVSALMGRGGADFHSPEIQLSAMRRMMVPAGLQEVAVIDDDIDVTGRTFSRTGVDKIRALAAAGRIDVLCVYNVARFGRNVLESLQLLSELADKGVTIMSASEHIDTSTPAGRMMLVNMLGVAEMQSDEIGRGWSAAIERRVELGHHHGKPLGYTRENKRMVPHPTLGPAITEVFRRYASGEPIGQIAAYLAAVRGRPMHVPNVKKLLYNPVYRGLVVAGGETLPGQHDALVDADTWQRVQDRLTADAGTPPRHLAPTWSLVGLVYCPNGHRLQRQPHRGRDGATVNRLVCAIGSSAVAGGDCPGVGRPLLDPVEAEVLQQVREYGALLRSDHRIRAARLARIRSARADRTALERTVSETRQAMVRLAKDRALRQLPDAVYGQALAELRETERTAVAELARMGPEPPPEDPAAAARAVDALLRLWPEMTYAERGRSLRTVVERIVVRPAAHWREPEADRTSVLFRW